MPRIPLLITAEAHEQLALYQLMTSPLPFLDTGKRVLAGVIIELDEDVYERLHTLRTKNETPSDTLIRFIKETEV